MDSLNRLISVGIAVVLALVVFISLRTPGEPPKDPWFEQAVLKNSHPVVVKFGADWCGPCRGMDAALDELKPRYSKHVKFLRIDVDQKPELFQHYASGSGIPQVMIFRDGQVIASQRGFAGTDALNQWIDSSL